MAKNLEEINDFDHLLDDNEGEQLDPTIANSYGGYYLEEEIDKDFDNFQNTSDSTKNTKIDDEPGFRDLSEDLLSDKDGEQVDDVTENSLILNILKSKNINPEAIKFEDENGNIESVRFSDLSDEDKINLLSSSEDSDEPEYDENELEAIEFLRENKMSLKDLVQKVKEKTISELSPAQEQTYSVDDFTDDELFIADFKNKYGDDFSNDELLDELEKAKENEDIFNKKMSKLRDDYKNYEIQLEENKKAEEENRIRQEQEEYVSTMVNVARSVKDIHNTIELDDDDKNGILHYIFKEDVNGETQIKKALSDPETLFRVAWYLKHGEETINQVHSYYQTEIQKLASKNNNNQKPISVVKDKPTQKQNQHTRKRPKTIEDLY